MSRTPPAPPPPPDRQTPRPLLRALPFPNRRSTKIPPNFSPHGTTRAKSLRCSCISKELMPAGASTRHPSSRLACPRLPRRRNSTSISSVLTQRASGRVVDPSPKRTVEAGLISRGVYQTPGSFECLCLQTSSGQFNVDTWSPRTVELHWCIRF